MARTFYDELVVGAKVYCFYASEVCAVITDYRRLPTFPKEKYPGHLSLQEMLIKWVTEEKCRMRSFSLEELESRGERNGPYAFISHRFLGSDGIGDDALEGLRQIGNELIFMDLCSMCQTGVTAVLGYEYCEDTKPAVDILHKIMKYASKAYVLLCQPIERQVLCHSAKEKFENFRESFKRSIFALETGSKIRMREDTLQQMKELLRLVENGYYPSNEYFGRLWCYVERLAMAPGRVYIYDSTFSNHLFHLNFEGNKQNLEEIRDIMKRFNHDCYFDFLRYFSPFFNYYASLFGIFEPGDSFPPGIPKVLGPFAQIELFECADEKDRITVAKIESSLRVEIFDEHDYRAVLDYPTHFKPVVRGRIPAEALPSSIVPIRKWVIQAVHLVNAPYFCLNSDHISKELLMFWITIKGFVHFFMLDRGTSEWSIGCRELKEMTRNYDRFQIRIENRAPAIVFRSLESFPVSNIPVVPNDDIIAYIIRKQECCLYFHDS
jgi:hypothetical protein